MLQPQESLTSQDVFAYPVGSVNSAFYEALERLCLADKQLGTAIRFARAGGIDGQTLVLEVHALQLEKAFRKLLRIVRLIHLTGAVFKRVSVNDRCIEITSLTQLHPGITENLTGVFDKRRNMELATQYAQRYRALLGFATSKATIFVLSVDGVYKDVHIQQGVESKISVEEMLNRPLDEVLPSLETALFIIQQVQEAYTENEPRTITYELWDRRYEAQIFPIAGAEEVVLACNRIK
jgi:hypothetical protein